ncbi:hypothetical protein SAMN05443637_13047 [Pseudonocardia thermophila]|jgi:hypothetical protein|uniref:Uncharacterized protein n=1 Tax=Pseudonocardia thermophila TaxID=1848 RepID=A0A1M7AWH6_PSETH|nr:hypothetical protein [Pseudonocardia thermophila]SHL47110.1 hypothetical protein SAMN05443637_13047 [Pseudonocardia thermophila]
MNTTPAAGTVIRHRLQTTYYLDGGAAVLVRRAYLGGGADVIWSSPTGGQTLLHHCTTRDEAELLGAAYAATCPDLTSEFTGSTTEV